MFEKDEGTEQRMKIDILKMVYYMLRDLGEDSGAEAIARAVAGYLRGRERLDGPGASR